MLVENLDIKSILNMSNDESLEHIRQLRLQRRTVDKKPQKEKTQKKSSKDNKIILSSEQADRIIKRLAELNNKG